MKSKENNVLQLFFDYPTKELHFEDICKETGIALRDVDRCLQILIRTKIKIKVKNKGKMPYYISNYDSSSYRNSKKLFAWTQLHTSGFLNHLASLPAKTVIIFGSIARSDWYKNSDIDLFIYGNAAGLQLAKYETKLQRDIQVFTCHNPKDLHTLGEGLIKNIIKGNIIKGDIDFVKVQINA